MNKHTPGPWFPEKHEEGFGVRFTPDCGNASWWVADVIGSQPYGFSDEANSHLIAAAPDLLEALEYCLDCLGDEFALPSDCQSTARSAIARARGEA